MSGLFACCGGRDSKALDVNTLPSLQPGPSFAVGRNVDLDDGPDFEPSVSRAAPQDDYEDELANLLSPRLNLDYKSARMFHVHCKSESALV